MPEPPQRDIETTRRRLARWLADRLPEAEAPEVGVEEPRGRGFGSETLWAVAEWQRAGTRRDFAVRMASTRCQVLPEPRLVDEYRVLRALAPTPVPVPAVLGYEADPAVLGAPFYVTERVDGWTPAERPPYHRTGALADRDEAGRAELWWAGLGVLRTLHGLDADRLNVAFLEHATGAPGGPGGLGGQLDFYERHLDHFAADRSGVVLAALDWLRENLPEPAGPPRLLWGDARLGNIVFRGARPAAVLGWETAFLGPPEADLAWFLHVDRHLAGDRPRLAGLPGRQATIERYEEWLGRPIAGQLPWHEVFAGFRFALVAARTGRLLAEQGLADGASEIPLTRAAERQLAATLAPLDAVAV
ncbi:phosphotransferase family protein [Streptomyces sp. NPDC004134]|uniref:phosphotransferase family protein n=1 Tax=Streptomyces sp. NPDC004134 TaxID=3364691 RepID=UPI0036B4301D